ncbi:MAG: rod shape-determining protein MreC [Proteobacteria bacterium]|nr:rod shape-determining protein MreC [Pseudomonadota bacterium]
MILRKKRNVRPVKCLAYLMLSIGLVLYQQFYTEVSSRKTFPWYTAASVITNLTRQPAIIIEDVFNGASSYIGAVKENKKLKEENARLKNVEKKAMFLVTENKELRYLVNMSKFMNRETLSANVYLDSSNLYVNSFLINLGLSSGVQPGFAVLNQEGLVGRVLEVGREYSRVLLINDYNAAVPVRILENGVQGILKGRNNSHHVRLITKERNSSAKTGQHVVTSSLQGIFDDGIPVGIVGNVSEEEIEIIPYANLNRINKVLVIKR